MVELSMRIAGMSDELAVRGSRVSCWLSGSGRLERKGAGQAQSFLGRWVVRSRSSSET